MVRTALLLAALTTTGCAALAQSGEFGHRPAMFDDDGGVPAKAHEPCRVYIVESVPEGSKRVGTIDVPADEARERRVDDVSRGYACDLNATHAVKEEEFTDRKGRAYWKMSVYRVSSSLF